MKKQSPFDLSWKHLYFLAKLLSVYVRLLWLIEDRANAYRTVNKLKSEIETLKHYKEKYRKRLERSHFKIKLKETEKSQASFLETFVFSSKAFVCLREVVVVEEALSV
jgi:hypothetical protein